MLKAILKAGGSIAKAASTKSPGDIIKAGANTVGLASKMKPKKPKKKKDEGEKQLRSRR